MRYSILLLVLGLVAAATTMGCTAKAPAPAAQPAPTQGAGATAQFHPNPQQIIEGEVQGIKQNPRLSPAEKSALISRIESGTMPGSPKWKLQTATKSAGKNHRVADEPHKT